MKTNQFVAGPGAQGSFVLGEPVPLEKAGTGKEIADRVREGRSVLEIVSTPWGIEFFVCDVVKSK